jgi:cyclohexyl-isocyanide hydratase
LHRRRRDGGIDFALAVAAEVAGSEAAERIQLALEYDPAPPFTAGNPRLAPASVRERVSERFAARLATFRGELEQAMAPLPS